MGIPIMNPRQSQVYTEKLFTNKTVSSWWIEAQILQLPTVILHRLLTIGFSLLDVSHKVHIRSWIMQHVSQYQQVGQVKTFYSMELSNMAFVVY